MCEVCNNTGVVNTLIGNVIFPVACSACCVTEPEPPKKPEPVCETDGNGNKQWTLNGKRHRADGPAIEWADGDKAWYLNGKEITEKDVMNPKGRVK